MNLNFAIEELAIVVAAANYSPTLLTPEFLKYSGIVPPDWLLSREPVLEEYISQVSFTNGINIVAQPGAITFSESLEGKAIGEIKIASIAKSYINALPHANYQGVSINPRIFVTFPGESEDAARQHIVTTLLASGSWQNLGKEPIRAAVNLTYSLDGRTFNLTITEAKLQLPEKPPQAAALYSGDFPYELSGEASDLRRQHLHQLIENWQTDLEIYKEIVSKQFLGRNQD